LSDEKDRYVPTDKAGWIRDTYTGAVLSVDHRGLKAYHERLVKIKETQSKIDNINTLEERIKHLEDVITTMAKPKDE